VCWVFKNSDRLSVISDQWKGMKETVIGKSIYLIMITHHLVCKAMTDY